MYTDTRFFTWLISFLSLYIFYNHPPLSTPSLEWLQGQTDTQSRWHELHLIFLHSGRENKTHCLIIFWCTQTKDKIYFFNLISISPKNVYLGRVKETKYKYASIFICTSYILTHIVRAHFDIIQVIDTISKAKATD